MTKTPRNRDQRLQALTADLIMAMRLPQSGEYAGSYETDMATHAVTAGFRKGTHLGDLRLVMAGVIAGRMAEAWKRDAKYLDENYNFNEEVARVLGDCWWW